METIRERFREWRISSGYTLKEVAGAISSSLGRELGPSAVSNYEKRNDPSVAVLRSMKEAFPELDLNWLVAGNIAPPNGVLDQPHLAPSFFYIPEAVEGKVREVADEVLNLPFKYPEMFLTSEEMTVAEKHTYALTMYAGLRQITRGICRDSRRFGPPG